MMVFTFFALCLGLLVSTCSAGGDYYGSCFQANILGTSDIFLLLEANCHTPPMGPPWVCTHLNLNLCYGNQNGVIVEQDKGMFGKTCDNCQLDGSILSCDCESGGDGNGGKRRSSIDTNNLIVNEKGWLKCYTYIGDKCPPDEQPTKRALPF
ncbi:hypothetical protein F5X96DRAFT_673704 [Biscogniauxia mediterranea]|nr:hypothetical protein F5X96DRAFT_673704 [Biscogniauxia mediterranea]